MCDRGYVFYLLFFFFFKQKTAYEMRISDWSSDVCSSDLLITITLMGVATAGVGMLPTYASAGIVAPILLVILRLAQGLALGGEYGGAAVYFAGNSPHGTRRFYTSFIHARVVRRLSLSLYRSLGDGGCAVQQRRGTWGWRIILLFFR